MKRSAFFPLVISLACAILIGCGSHPAYADDLVYIKGISVEQKPMIVAKHGPSIGCVPITYTTEVYLSDGTTAQSADMKQMSWIIERYDNVSKTYTTVQTGDGEDISFWQPYGTKPGQYRITATSKVEPDAWGETWYQLHYPWYTETFCICKPGEVKDRKVEGKQPGASDIQEIYNWDTEKYTCILPECPYTVKDYMFVGWKNGKKTYQPGDVYVSGYGDEPDGYNAHFTAQWKPKFENPNLVVNKKGSKKIKLSWNKMAGAKGYKIYRATKQNGKYKLVKTITNNKKTTWIDTKVKKGKKYYYKVVAYKKQKGKTINKKSAWALATTKAAKVTSVKPSKGSIQGKVGQITTVKAKVNTAKGKKLSKKVRWYTSNKNIAAINQKTGKITFKQAGTCYIWAKAYNGKISKKIKVRVE